ncbi:MAG: hypothetical protein ACP5T0_06830 [Verrucomicrobiia bacterium]
MRLKQESFKKKRESLASLNRRERFTPLFIGIFLEEASMNIDGLPCKSRRKT